ncbi:MAG: TraR/DksA family transcriptional regulator [Acidimicrobiia bacterium]|nr:TraR/DksA family transcriptional regulator [Acidimicrobiia bacterium]
MARKSYRKWAFREPGRFGSRSAHVNEAGRAVIKASHLHVGGIIGHPASEMRAEGAAGIMATTRKSAKGSTAKSRYNELKQMLEDRRRELMNEVQGRMRDVRADGNKDRDVLDQGESSEVDIQEDIEFALIQMKSETLNKINAALGRLDEGTYGNCYECGDEIAEARLRALPFAARCKDCEEARENAELRERQLARKGSSALFFDMSN